MCPSQCSTMEVQWKSRCCTYVHHEARCVPYGIIASTLMRRCCMHCRARENRIAMTRCQLPRWSAVKGSVIPFFREQYTLHFEGISRRPSPSSVASSANQWLAIGRSPTNWEFSPHLQNVRSATDIESL